MKTLHEQVALVGRRVYRFTKACRPIIAVRGGGEIAQMEDGLGAIIRMESGLRVYVHFDREEDTISLCDLVENTVLRGVDKMSDEELAYAVDKVLGPVKYYVIGTFGNIEKEVLAGPFDDFHAAKLEADYLWVHEYNRGRSRHTPSMGHNSGITSIGISTEVKNV